MITNFELSGDDSGYRVYEFWASGQRVAWVVVATTTGPYTDPRFAAGNEYWYSDVDLSRLDGFDIKIAQSGRWPGRWDYPTTAAYTWRVLAVESNFVRESAPPDSDAQYFQPVGDQPTNTLEQWCFKWPTPNLDGQVQFWASTSATVLSGSVGDQWSYEASSPRTLDGWLAVNVIPRQSPGAPSEPA